MKNKFILFLLSGFLLISPNVNTFALEDTNKGDPASEAQAVGEAGFGNPVSMDDKADPNYDYALELQKLNVLTGTGAGFELNREPTRVEGAVMFVRLLGKEDEALEKQYPHPFTDVPKWADPYVGYLYHADLTKGIGDNKFGSNDKLNLKSYLAFVLRCLGYSEDKGDFDWGTVEDKAVDLKVVDEDMLDTDFKRSEMAKVSVTALDTQLKDSDLKLINILKVPDGFNFYTATPVNITEDNWLTNFAGSRDQELTIQIGKLIRSNCDFTEEYIDLISNGTTVTLAANGARYEYYEGTNQLKKAVIDFLTGKKFDGTDVVKDYSEGFIKLVLIVEYDEMGNGKPQVLFYWPGETYLADYQADNYYKLGLESIPGQ